MFITSAIVPSAIIHVHDVVNWIQLVHDHKQRYRVLPCHLYVSQQDLFVCLFDFFNLKTTLLKDVKRLPLVNKHASVSTKKEERQGTVAVINLFFIASMELVTHSWVREPMVCDSYLTFLHSNIPQWSCANIKKKFNRSQQSRQLIVWDYTRVCDKRWFSFVLAKHEPPRPGTWDSHKKGQRMVFSIRVKIILNIFVAVFADLHCHLNRNIFVISLGML